MNTDPFRLHLLKQLTGALKEISVANGYKTDLLDSVFRGRVLFGENDPLPMVSILEVPIPLDQIESPPDTGLSTGIWELMIQGFAQDDIENPTDPAHVLMADVKQRLAQENAERKHFESSNSVGMKGKIKKLRFGAGVVRPPDEISAVAYFWLNLTLDMVEDLSDPYNY